MKHWTKTFVGLVSLAIALVVSPAVNAQPTGGDANIVRLAWEPSPEPEVGGYRLYFTQDTNAWTHVKILGLVSQTQVNVPKPGQWFFTITATNLAGLESVPSNIVQAFITNAPAGVLDFRLVSVTTVRAATITTVTNLTFVP